MTLRLEGFRILNLHVSCKKKRNITNTTSSSFFTLSQNSVTKLDIYHKSSDMTGTICHYSTTNTLMSIKTACFNSAKYQLLKLQMKLHLPFFLLICGKLLWLQANSLGNDTDYFALLKFKESITNHQHGILNSWNDSTPFCSWFGIRCSSRHHRVTSMVLSGQNLVGSISPYIANMSFLRIIDLRNNSLQGAIPREVHRLFRLQRLVLNNNTIGGEIPVSIANCSQLRRIHLGINEIVGMIPVEIGSLKNLQMLYLWGNNLRGEIPSSIGNISSLSIFSVAFNSMEGSVPEDMGRLTNLTILQMNDNNFSGLFPPSIFNISSLNIITLVKNKLRGTLPDNIDLTLPNLQTFAIGGNRFSGNIPKSISNCSRLEVLDIPDNKFVGQVPANLGKLRNLSRLNLGNNDLGSNSTGDLAFITSLTNCSNMHWLIIWNNDFGGTLPNSVANLSTQLQYLYFGSNQISGTIPASLDNLVSLVGLSLANNNFTGSIPSYFGKFRELQALSLAQNRLSGQIPSALGNLTRLTALYLYDNELEGSIPSSIENCQMLSSLDLSSNNLNGEIPPPILLLPSLSDTLALGKNMLTGSLPPQVGKLQKLNRLYVAENNLSGKIPESIGECTNLEYLYLEGNSFDGTIPLSLVSLRGLRYLDVSRNNLSGQIVQDLQDLPFLEYLNLSLNNLEGEVPGGGVFENVSQVSLHGNSKLCGGIPEFGLPTCPSKPIQEGKTHNFKTAIIIVCVVVLVLLISTFSYLYWKRNSKRNSSPSIPVDGHLIKVSYGDLYKATSGFSLDNEIGYGGFSTVYKGFLVQVEKPVAVKVLNLGQKGGKKSFEVECRALRNIRHRNLVKVLTYCSSIDYKGNEFKALVYEFMENGNLDKWLHSREDNSSNLSIMQRLNIAIDVASALHYLHDLCDTPVVHCDLKPSNILLNDDMVAHLSDFGLARLFSSDNDTSHSQTSTVGMKGTIGYAAPEYGTAAAVSKEGDVYSYGILLLEMFSGRRPTDEMFSDGLNLHDFVKAALPARLLQIIDPSILPRDAVTEAVADSADNNGVEDGENKSENHGQMGPNMEKCLPSVLEIALACSVESPKDRLSMIDVTRRLHLIKIDFLGEPRTRVQHK